VVCLKLPSRFIDGCETGGGDFASLIYPYFIYSFETTTDQAVLGWNVFALIDHKEIINENLWSRLRNKMTVGQALENMVNVNNSLSRGLQWFKVSDYGSGLPVRNATDNDYDIQGDPNTRIHGVYTGNESLPADHNWWY
jgi:hypothetical protein